MGNSVDYPVPFGYACTRVAIHRLKVYAHWQDITIWSTIKGGVGASWSTAGACALSELPAILDSRFYFLWVAQTPSPSAQHGRDHIPSLDVDKAC